jgi:hypothetical protein
MFIKKIQELHGSFWIRPALPYYETLQTAIQEKLITNMDRTGEHRSSAQNLKKKKQISITCCVVLCYRGSRFRNKDSITF